MQIADKLKQRYGSQLKLIGFDNETYRRTLSQVILPENRLSKLDSLKNEELVCLGQELKKTKRAAYEEENIEYIVHFIENEIISIRCTNPSDQNIG